MKLQTYLALTAVTMLPLVTASAQNANSIAPQPVASSLSPGAAEVAKLAQSGVGDDVIIAFIEQSHSYFSLSADNTAALKSAGVSSPVLTAMLNHDNALSTPQSAGSPTAAAQTPTTAAGPQADNGPVAVTSSPADAAPTAVVQPTPPPPPVEVIPVSPGPDYLWMPGGWSWNGGAWIWIGGYWHYPSRPGHVWVGGQWVGHGRSGAWGGGHRR